MHAFIQIGYQSPKVGDAMTIGGQNFWYDAASRGGVGVDLATESLRCVLPGRHLDAQRAAEANRLHMLLQRVGQADKAAFAELYDASAARIYGMVLKVLRDPGYSEETTQETFLQIWRTAASYDPDRGSPLSWMMTLAHRRAVDRVRSAQSGSNRESQYGSTTHNPAYDQVLESVTQRMEAEAVVRCLDTLTRTQQEAVHMAYYRGLTYRE
ncbi:MAG: ECF RNA polymerase sigma factor SigK, partial [Mycobacteriaceae bacterium]|nr:ECF RNA polymerase sigma factor SigK [Mycobacteriaceae bacterium]